MHQTAYSTATTANGRQTYLMRGNETVAIFISPTHAQDAAQVLLWCQQQEQGGDPASALASDVTGANGPV